ncbi:MAG: efflux RND transporter periplasmic adaptor subunit [Treponema sp.]|jgi:multidrug efflux pump subunit AcrA (membrane-fusion protein)|nr:efflux RND transporter periplasmic adaptor subunit [Treponema sp.]
MKTEFSPHNIKRRLAAGAAVFAVFSLLAFPGCERIKETYNRIRPAAQGGPSAPQEALVFAVNTTAAVQGQIQDYIALSGDIVAGSTVDTYSEAAGKITRVYVSVGQWVNRGAAVAAVDPSRPGMTYRVSVATAPISGTVVALPAQVGMTISQSVPLARISGGGALEIRLYVAERFISKMAMNLPCEISLDAWPGEVFQGSVSELAPTVDPASRTMEVRINVNNAGSKLKAGMFAKVRIITERKENIVKIPSSALINRFGEQYVFIVDRSNPAGPVARKKVIVPGILIDGALEVQQGLSPNDEVIIRGQTLLEDGARVNIIDQVNPLNAE